MRPYALGERFCPSSTRFERDHLFSATNVAAAGQIGAVTRKAVDVRLWGIAYSGPLCTSSAS